jgi:hypothetical protein
MTVVGDKPHRLPFESPTAFENLTVAYTNFWYF